MGELEEKETPPTETTAAQQETLEEPKETDKMLDTKKTEKTPSPQSSKPATPNAGKKSPVGEKTNEEKGHEIIDIPEEKEKPQPVEGSGAAAEEKKISKEEREVKPKKIPIGGLKLPGFFMKNKPKAEGDGAEGELLEKDAEDKDKEAAALNGDAAAAAAAAEPKPRPGLGQRLRSFFVRKPGAEKEKKALVNGDADAKSEATAEAAAAEEAAVDPPPKRGLLNAIKLPIANMIPKQRKNGDDVEMGLGGKAGLASMETLDDSLKDQDTVDRAPVKNANGTDDIKSELKDEKLAAEQKLAAEEDERDRPVSLLRRLRGYKCSVDDALIVFGILLFMLLLAVIGYVLTHETLTSPPLREGRYILAVTGCGPVEGVKEDGAFAFRGIPYAKAPVDELRWRSAQLIDSIDGCWNDTLQTHNSSVVCTQRLGNGTTVGDEDCLYLDVVTPHVRYTNPLPVVVLIGAESLAGPSPGILRPSARYSRSHDVIFVRPNFRLGIFGFLALDSLTKEAHPRTSGNYALTDIIAVLKWIQLNIVNFGGDPKSVTLLGHRAGATLVSALVSSPKLKDLYTRAWSSSGSAIFPGKPLAEAEKLNQQLMVTLDCIDVECLRDASSEKLWAATPDTWLHFPQDLPQPQEINSGSRHEWLVLDGDVLFQHPSESWKRDQATEQPLLVVGATAHEAHTEKLRELHANWTKEEVRQYLNNSQIGALGLTDEVIERYNATNYAALVSIITDIRTVCPLLTNARLQPSVPFYVVTQGEGVDQLATVDADVQAILGRYEPHTVEQRRYVSAMQQLFYYYVSHGTVQSFEPRRRVINVGQDAQPQEDYEHCNYWISKDIVPRYARID
ncbi:neurotactin [Drosophila obscura]|uniref:neurotactin n=1 Tax=Drosophila obscura TaxID=7282 RepID=UPI001BB23BB3|nr:neurotactin [Drosophila obscura]XP_022215333.2 neurotactin [Drosophila obscura]